MSKQQYLDTNVAKRKIALVNLFRQDERSKKLKYIATRVYDPITDTVVDEVVLSNRRVRGISSSTASYALWAELPALNTAEKRLVGKNKELYCTLISVRVLIDETYDALKKPGEYTVFPIIAWDERKQERVQKQVRALGYTFMDINGDKKYITTSQLRKSDILEHVHSVDTAMYRGEMLLRKCNVSQRMVGTILPLLEESVENTLAEDEEVEHIKMCKALVGGWHTMSASGALQIDLEALTKANLEEVQIPEGIISLPSRAFYTTLPTKRVVLPETLRAIGQYSFFGLWELEEINIPSRVTELSRVFKGQEKLNTLDIQHIKKLMGFGDIHAKRLILPDVLQENSTARESVIDVLEFCNTANAARRVLKANAGKTSKPVSVWKVGRIETNGPVVLGNYKVSINCVAASALEPNIVGIAPDSSFHKVDGEGNPQPWLLGPATEFVYTAHSGGYLCTAAACTANKLRVAVVCTEMDTVLPESVEILQGHLSRAMCEAEYPNVVYASYNLCWAFGNGNPTNIATKMPSLMWILPGTEVYTEAQIKRTESKLTPILPEICKHTQELLKLDLTNAENLARLKQRMLCFSSTQEGIAALFARYGMIYVGDYGAALGDSDNGSNS